MKRVLLSIMLVILAFCTISCRKFLDEDLINEYVDIGISMPNDIDLRWKEGASYINKKFDDSNKIVEIRYAKDDIETQIKQLNYFIDKNVKFLVVSAINDDVIKAVENRIIDKNIILIAYEKAINNSDAVSYYLHSDKQNAGEIIGHYIVNSLGLKEPGRQYTIEFFIGDSDDADARTLYNSSMQILSPFIDNGTLICLTRRSAFEETSIQNNFYNIARERCESYIRGYYGDERINICFSTSNEMSNGVIDALLNNGYSVNDRYSLITGFGSEKDALKKIKDGYQTMTAFYDSNSIANECVNIINGESNENEIYYNGIKNVPTFKCGTVLIDKNNVDEFID